MSEVAETTEKPNVMEETSLSEATTKKMTRGDYLKAEHLVQTGQSETLPDGRNVDEVREGLFELQKKQEDAQTEKDKRWTEQANKNAEQKSGDEFLNEEVEVSGFANGASSARPVPDKTDESKPVANPNDPLSDLPEDFPGRKHLIAAKVYSLEAVAKLDFEGLKAIDNIGDATAEAILKYGK